jgi:hypothetical protein
MRLRVKMESNEWYYINDKKILSVFFWDPDPPILSFFRPTLLTFFSGEKKKGFFLS